MPYYKNLTEIVNTGNEAFIYQIEGSVKGIWYVRIKRHNANGYFRKSLKTNKFAEASKRALQHWLEVRDAEKQNIVLTPGTTFAILAKRWLVERRKRYGDGTNVLGVEYQFKNYFIPFFGNDSVEHITDQRYRAFLNQHRLVYPARKKPKLSTLFAEQCNFNSFLMWCYETQHIRRKIRISNIRDTANRWIDEADKVDRHFKKRTELATYAAYCAYRDFFNKAVTWNHPRIPEEPFHVTVNRRRSAFYMMTLYNLCCRPGEELLQAKWGDLVRHSSVEKEGAFYVTLTVRHGKKVKRNRFDGVNELTYISDYRYLDMLANWRTFLVEYGFPTGPNDFLFPLKKGRRDSLGRRLRARRNQPEEYYTYWDSRAAGAFLKRSRKKVLDWKAANLERDGKSMTDAFAEEIMAFTWYSVRHVSIKRMLQESKFPIHYVAEKANTGISMIEDFYGNYMERPEGRIVARHPIISPDKKEIRTSQESTLDILGDIRIDERIG